MSNYWFTMRGERAILASGALSAVVSGIMGVIAFTTVIERGLVGTGFLIVTCYGGVRLGKYAYRQHAHERKLILFGCHALHPPRTMVEPGWSVVSVLAAICNTIIVLATY